MQLGIVGVGRMGGDIARRLLDAGHECVVFDLNPVAARALEAEGARATTSLDEFVAALRPPRAAWVMVPAGGPTTAAIEQLAERFDADDVIIDGGNSHYHDDIAHAEHLAQRGIHHLDVGTSGGVWGRMRGYCLMIGGEGPIVSRLEPLFAAIAPGMKAAPRTPGRSGEPSPAERGYLHCGPHGAGHFVKMIHNGIEYGAMAALAEGLNILEQADAGTAERQADAETAPLARPELYRYDFDLTEIAEVWRRGSVISSWLLDLTAAALHESPDLAEFSGRVSDSGEGRWAALAAIDEGVPAPMLLGALFGRFSSREHDRFANRVLSAMRGQFGGHAEKPAE